MKHARRRIGSLLLACALILTLLPVNALAEEPDTWDGSADTTWYNGSEAEFTITSAEELAGLAVLVNNGTNFSKKTIQLSKSLDLSGANWTPIGMSGKRFQGTFDGAGHAITGMRAINNLAYGNGFFGDITGGAVIKNLTFNDARVARYDDTRVSGNVYGIVCGYAYGTVTFENIHVRASSLTGYGKAGAILGMAADPGGTTILKNCTVESTDIYVAYNGGGLIGLALNNVALENSTC